MKTHLLSIPSKKTEDVNWTKTLNNYLLSIYGNTSEYQQDLEDFDKLRHNIKGVHPDETGIKLYFKYYGQLELLDLRISFQTANKHKKVTFVWYDAFLLSVEHKQYALPFEKACVLFNLGAILSKAAVRKYKDSCKDSSDDSHFKQAVQLFEQSAGVYEFLNENFLHAPSADLQQSTVKFLSNLNLAQRQEVFNLKVISGDLDQTKNAIIAKLCMGTSNLYARCYKSTQHLMNADSSEPPSTYSVVDSGLDEEINEEEFDPAHNPDTNSEPDDKVAARVDPVWIAIIRFKELYYKSLSFYFQGLQLEANKKYGQAIAYLSKSKDILEEISGSALKLISKSGADVYEVLDNYKYQKDAVGIKLSELNKDNDLIYNEIVPSTTSLAEVKGMDSSKAIPINKIPLFSEVNEQNYNNFLNNVVPINIHELLSYYSEEKSQFLRKELDEVDISNEELSSVLEYLKMPKALVNLKEIILGSGHLETGGNITSPPQSVLNQVNEISTKYRQDLSNKDSISRIRNQIYQVIQECESMLSSTISESSIELKQSLIKVKKSIYDASNADSRLFGLINNENGYLYSVLGKGIHSDEFKQLFEVSQPGKGKQPEMSLLDIDFDLKERSNMSLQAQIKEIEDTLHQLNVLKSNKLKLVDNLKSEIHSDDISDILILNCKVKSTNEIKEVIFPEELKKFEPFSVELDKLINEQKRLINSLNEQWSALNSNSEIKDAQSSKQFQADLMRDQSAKIEAFYLQSWKIYSDGLKRGVEIYNQLLNYANGIKQRIQQQNAPLNQQFSGMSLNSSHSSFGGEYNRPPPALPPKPQSQQSIHSQGQSQSYNPGYNQGQGQVQNQNLGQNQMQQQKPQTIYDQPSTYQPNMYNFFSSN